MSYTRAFGKSDFQDCFKRAKKGEFKGVPITVIDKADLIKEKEMLARQKTLMMLKTSKSNTTIPAFSVSLIEK